MRNPVHFLQKAENDVEQIVSYIESENDRAVQRFREKLQETVEIVSDMPDIGSKRLIDTFLLKDIRVVPVKEFSVYFVFYRAYDRGIEIVRVLHGARDYPLLFK